jgi:DNA-binding MurR/RpiR family transcriptional regulator
MRITLTDRFHNVNIYENIFSEPFGTGYTGTRHAKVMRAMDSSKKSLVNLIHQAYPGLTSGERKVADLVLEFPGELAAYAASELAELAGVSNATVTRFVKRLGFGNYEAARRASRDARDWGSPLFLASKASETEAQDGDLIKRFADEETALLNATLAGLTPELVDDVTTALAGAKRLYFFGFRNSHYLAAYARWQFIQFRRNVHLFPGAGETLGERIADLGPGDIVVIVGVRRLVAKLRRYTQAIQATGADILLLTDPSARITPAYARWTVICTVENPHIFDCYSGPLCVLRLLAFETFQKLGSAGRKHLQEIERHHETLGEFD